MRRKSHRARARVVPMEIKGMDVDGQGRCRHYRGTADVVANRCATCREYWACHACHSGLADHPFGRMPVDAPAAVLCSACGRTMGYEAYSQAAACPACAHPFNPGCAVHAPLYFEV